MQTHIIQRLPLVGDLYDLHACVHSRPDLHICRDGDVGETERSGAGLVEVGEEGGGEFGAGVDGGAEAEVHGGEGPGVGGREDEGAAG